MNSRERVETELNFKQPDRTPIFASLAPAHHFQADTPIENIMEFYHIATHFPK